MTDKYGFESSESLTEKELSEISQL